SRGPARRISDPRQAPDPAEIQNDRLAGRGQTQSARGAYEGGRFVNCPTLLLYRRVVPLDEGKALLARPETVYVAPEVRASWDPTKDFRLKTFTADDFASFRRADARRLLLARQLHDAGARLILGTDFSNPYVVPGFSIHEELGFLVTAGLTPYDAIRMGTVNAAAYLGDDFGEVAPGKRA